MLDTPDKKKDFKKRTGLKTVPQVYISSTGHHIGGYEELQEYVKL
jgi:glutaredoxin